MNKREFLKSFGWFGLGGALAFGLESRQAQPLSLETCKSHHQKDYEDILNKRVIRAAYIAIPPEMQKDLVTGKLSGICYDISENLAKEIGIKIDWVEEVNFGNLHEGLGTRYDVLFFTLYRNAKQGQVVDYTQPLFYSGTGLYMRSDDKRFADDIERLNSPDITLATLDGEMSQIIAQERFPKARQASHPQNTDIGQLLLDVISGKADATFVNEIVASKFLDSYPGKLTNIAAHDPLAVFGHAFVVAKGQTFLRDLFDLGLEQIQQTGAINAVLKKYEPHPGAFLRKAQPYAEKTIRL